MRYPPYTDAKIKKYVSTQGIPSPNFNRSGKLLYNSWFWKIALLGAARPKAGLLRYILALLGMHRVLSLLKILLRYTRKDTSWGRDGRWNSRKCIG
jgi:hypothetical protein